MPLVDLSSYRPPVWLRNAHVQTIYPSRFRRVDGVGYERERLDLPDGDFVDVDWHRRGAARAVVLAHGLAGSARRPYMLGMARVLGARGWDVAAFNFRGCSGEPNRRWRAYHSGETDDLDAVVRRVRDAYETVALVGFSLGGNIVLKYLGERGHTAPVEAAVAFSVPCDLAAAAAHMRARGVRVYLDHLLRGMRRDLRLKQHRFPEEVRRLDLDACRTFDDIDGAYTAPAHGFPSAEVYWRENSSRRFLDGIRVPTLLVNAADDPILPGACYPRAEAAAHDRLWLEEPSHGGHIGFIDARRDGAYWSERRAAGFLEGDRLGERTDAARGAFQLRFSA